MRPLDFATCLLAQRSEQTYFLQKEIEINSIHGAFHFSFGSFDNWDPTRFTCTIELEKPSQSTFFSLVPNKFVIASCIIRFGGIWRRLCSFLWFLLNWSPSLPPHRERHPILLGTNWALTRFWDSIIGRYQLRCSIYFVLRLTWYPLIELGPIRS